jgi:uncharacterized protein YndB with AHSA1/START domain
MHCGYDSKTNPRIKMPTTQDLITKATITINAPRAEVWKALVSPPAVKQYMFGADVRTDWKEGSPITWSGEWQGKRFQDKGKILQVKPERVLQYTHFSPLAGQPDAPENYHTVTIELADVGGKTQVTLTQDNNSTEEARKESEKNWKMMLQGL